MPKAPLGGASEEPLPHSSLSTPPTAAWGHTPASHMLTGRGQEPSTESRSPLLLLDTRSPGPSSVLGTGSSPSPSPPSGRRSHLQGLGCSPAHHLSSHQCQAEDGTATQLDRARPSGSWWLRAPQDKRSAVASWILGALLENTSRRRRSRARGADTSQQPQGLCEW